MSTGKILIVEDELVVANDVKESLTQVGHTVVGIATTAEDAVVRAVRERPDLILMDIRLAGIRDGVSAALEIRARLEASVIFLTAYADVRTIERAKPSEPLAYITKPFKNQDLFSAVELGLYRTAKERERNEASRTILFFATHDLLTGLLNRNEALTRLTLTMQHSRAFPGPSSAVVFLDLVDFKRINDSGGHAAGDEVLSETGRRISGMLEANEYACRWGGDEFVFVIRECRGEDQAQERVRALLNALGQPLADGVSLNADIGVVFGLGGFADAEAVIREADRRMYEAKRSRQNEAAA